MDPYGNPGFQGQGFHNIDPRTREERTNLSNGDALQRARIQQRHGNQFALPYDPVSNPVVPIQNSPMYADETYRFVGTAAQQEAARRQAEMQKREANYERLRGESHYREQQRWNNMETETKRHEDMLATKRETGTGQKVNHGSEHYNILNLNYNATPQGQVLQYKDQTHEYRAQLRAHNLYNKGNSVNHNIITGELRQAPIPTPQRPIPPWERQQ